jgi:hypothetical protein
MKLIFAASGAWILDPTVVISDFQNVLKSFELPSTTFGGYA